MDFVEATDALMRKLTADDLAELFGCSKQSVHQARVNPASVSYRSPPPNWEDAACRAATKQAMYFLDLAGKLHRHADNREPLEKRIAKLRQQLAELKKRVSTS